MGTHWLTALEDTMIRCTDERRPHLWLPGVDHRQHRRTGGSGRILAKEGIPVTKSGGRSSWNVCGNDKQCRSISACSTAVWAPPVTVAENSPLTPDRHWRHVLLRHLNNKRLIYRGERIINWCPACATTLSDLEVDHKDLNGPWHLKYPLADGDGYLIVATTRPETMLGDTP